MPVTISSAIVAGIGLTGTVATIATAVIAAGITAALAYGQQALFGAKQPEPQTLLNQGQKQVVKRAIAYRRTIYGHGNVQGAISFAENVAPDLFIQYILAEHECDGLDSAYVQGTRVFFDENGNATSTPFFDGADVFLQVSMRLGTADQPIDALIAANFPEVSSNFRQRGHTVATCRFFYGNNDDQHREKWGQENNIHPIFRMRGKKVYDPRDPAQLPDDASTWVWTDNWALCVVDFLRSPNGGRKTSSDIDWAFIRAAADVCDQQVARKDGTSEKRYTLNGVYDTSQTPAVVLREMLSAARGRVIWVNGKVRVVPGIAQAPVMTISQDMLAGPFDYRSEAPRDELVNVVEGKFVSPERNNKSADAPILERTDLIALDGQRRQVSLSHPWVEEHTRAQRLNTAFLKQSRFGKALQITTDPRTMRLTGGSWCRVEFEDFPWLTGLYAVEKMVFVDNFSKISLSLSEASEEVYEYDPQTDEQDYLLQEAA